MSKPLKSNDNAGNNQVGEPRGQLGRTYLTVRQAAEYLRVSKSFLDKARVSGKSPPFVRIGRRILYDRNEIDAWADSRRCPSTSAYGADTAKTPLR